MLLTSFLIISIALHAMLGGFVHYAPRLAFMQELAKRLNHTIEDKTEDVVTQIELINEEDLRRQVVSQNEKSINDQIPEEDYFLSQSNQTVEQATRAANVGKFNNASAPGAFVPPQRQIDPAPQAKSKAQPQQELPRIEKTPEFPRTASQAAETKPKTKAQKLGLTGASFEDTVERTAEQAIAAQAGQRGFAGDGFSQTDDHLKDIPIGERTLLNTREFIYYSYFARVKEQLRSHWNPQVRHSVQLLFAKDDRRLASVDIKSTSLRITLDKKGYLKKIELLKTSGFKELDVAAIEAFRAAAPFLNPPSGLVEKDGTIKVFWDFILES